MKRTICFHGKSWRAASLAVVLTGLVSSGRAADAVADAKPEKADKPEKAEKPAPPAAIDEVIVNGKVPNVRINVNGVEVRGNVGVGGLQLNVNGANVQVAPAAGPVRGDLQVGPRVGAGVLALGKTDTIPALDKPPLAPEAEKELTELLGKFKDSKRKYWEKRMEKEMDDMVQQTGMGEDERKALAEPSKQAIEACLVLWLDKMESYIRKALQRSPRASTQLFNNYRQAVDTYAENDIVPGVKQPIDNEAWVEGWKKVLNPQHLEGWKKAVLKREVAAREEMKDVLKPFEDRFQTQFTNQIGVRTAEIKETLQLPADRAKALDELAKKAVAESMAAWQKRVQASIVSMPAQRRTMMLQGRLFFGNEKSEAPDLQPAWVEGLPKLLGADEQKRLEGIRAEHKSRRVQTLAQLFLVYIDDKLALTATQRERLRPIAEKLVQAQPSLFPQENDDNNFNQFNGMMLTPRMILAAGVNAPEKEVRAIVEDIQWAHWKQACQPQNDEYGMPAPVEEPKAASAEGAEPEPVEELISAFMATRSTRQRAKLSSAILLQAEDAARVAKLSPDAYQRLQIGARGAAEKALLPWKVQFEQIVRGNLGEVTPQTLKMRLQQMDNFNSYQVPGDKPPLQSVWKKTVERELTAEQRAVWDKEVEARKQFRDKTIVGAILAEFDRQVPLRKEQWDKLEPMMQKIITEYTDEIGTFFSFSEGSAWYLQNYTRFMPLAGIPEEELKALLGKEQWDRWTTTEEFANAKNYWNNIRQNHQNRIRR